MPRTLQAVATRVRMMRSGSEFVLVVKTNVVRPDEQVKALAQGSGRELAFLGSDVSNRDGKPITLIKIKVN